MDLSLSFASGSSEEQNSASSHKTRRRSAHRHTFMQIQRLEEVYKNCPHPDEEQRQDLSKELGLEPNQIKFWFQNKRTQTKAINERIDNNALRAENERIQSENSAIREVLKNVACPACGGPSYGDEERKLTMKKLIQENAYLKQEFEKATRLVADYAGNPMLIQKNFLTLGTPSTSSSKSILPGGGNKNNSNNMLPKQGNNKALMWETAICAREELMRLLRVEEPLWITSQASAVDDVANYGFFYLPNPETYERMFPRDHQLRKKLIDARVECSKASTIVNMPPLLLVDMFLDCEKWVSLFPTIVGRASTVKVLEAGAHGSRSEALQLIYEEVHMVTPMVAPREYVFLRYCHQPEIGTWVICDVSFVPLEETGIPAFSSPFWKLPSGCMIQQLPNGFSKVTWVEHVEVEHEKLIVHMLYRNLVFSSISYGAQRWVAGLERMCERVGHTMSTQFPLEEATSLVMNVPDGRRSLMKLGHRMVNDFCEVISTNKSKNRNDGFEEISEGNINNGMRMFIRNNLERGEAVGTILTAASSMWLPLPPNQIFHYLCDVSRRFQWDLLCHESSDQEVVRISTGAHPAHYISVIQTYSESKNIAIIQETCVEPMGCLVVYAPVDKVAMKAAMQGHDSAAISILPSGFVVTRDNMGRSGGGGSIVTLTVQILTSDNGVEMRNMSLQNSATASHLVTTTLDKIKFALMN